MKEAMQYDDDDELQMSLDDELALAESMLNEIQLKINGMGSTGTTQMPILFWEDTISKNIKLSLTISNFLY